MNYSFRKAKQGEPEKVFSLIEERVKWMDRKGICQWNATDYLNIYPLDYYQKNIDRLYVLSDETAGDISAAAVLLREDERWDSEEPAVYIHNFVSAIGQGKAGNAFIFCLEKYALENGIHYLRLDSADDNEKLAKYYEDLGFVACGTCRDGKYHGILREKKL